MSTKQKEIGEHTFFDVRREEVGRINLTKGIDLVVYMAGDHLDMRLWVDRYPYKGLRFFLPEGTFEELKELIEGVDEAYKEKLLTRDPGEVAPNENAETLRKLTCKI